MCGGEVRQTVRVRPAAKGILDADGRACEGRHDRRAEGLVVLGGKRRAGDADGSEDLGVADADVGLDLEVATYREERTIG
jgi:hypothetical protein